MTDSSPRRRKILVVDDEPRMIHFIRLNLEHDGFEVYEATSGTQALDQMRDRLPDLVLLDVMMPDLDGFETLRLIRDLSTVPVIMLTAKGEEEDRVRGLELGADDYIVKPFSPRQLVARTKAVLRRAGKAAAAPIHQAGDLNFDRSRREIPVQTVNQHISLGYGFQGPEDLSLGIGGCLDEKEIGCRPLARFVDEEALFFEDLGECLFDPRIGIPRHPKLNAGRGNRSRFGGRAEVRLSTAAGVKGGILAERGPGRRRRDSGSGNRELLDLQRISQAELVVTLRFHQIYELQGIARNRTGRQGEDRVRALDTHGLLAANFVTTLQDNHVAGGVSRHDRDQKNRDNHPENAKSRHRYMTSSAPSRTIIAVRY